MLSKEKIFCTISYIVLLIILEMLHLYFVILHLPEYCTLPLVLCMLEMLRMLEVLRAPSPVAYAGSVALYLLCCVCWKCCI